MQLHGPDAGRAHLPGARDRPRRSAERRPDAGELHLDDRGAARHDAARHADPVRPGRRDHRHRSPSFTFAAEAGSTFECAARRASRSPSASRRMEYSDLAPGDAHLPRRRDRPRRQRRPDARHATRWTVVARARDDDRLRRRPRPAPIASATFTLLLRPGRRDLLLLARRARGDALLLAEDATAAWSTASTPSRSWPATRSARSTRRRRCTSGPSRSRPTRRSPPRRSSRPRPPAPRSPSPPPRSTRPSSARSTARRSPSATRPPQYTGLSVGPHTFAVRATDAEGNADATPASFSWTDRAPPDTTAPQTTHRLRRAGRPDQQHERHVQPSRPTSRARRFSCSLDGGPFIALHRRRRRTRT